MPDDPRSRRLVELDGAEIAVEVALGASADRATLRVAFVDPAEREERAVCVLRSGEAPIVLVDGRVLAFRLDPEHPEAGIVLGGQTRHARVSAGRAASGARSAPPASGLITAPMPGRVVEVRVAVGERVSSGSTLIVIEAMKMQNELFSPGDGEVRRVLVQAGDAVERGAALIDLG